MKSNLKKTILPVLISLLIAVLSFFPVAERMTDPSVYRASIQALEEKQNTVLELTAASTAASAAITLLPGDTATPIADKLADLSGYFLIVLCALFLEKYLLTITAYAAFRLLIPLACVIFILYVFSPRRTLAVLIKKLLGLSLAILLVIPASIQVSAIIEDTYQASIDAAVEEAKQTASAIDRESGEADNSSSNFFSKVTEGLTSVTSGAVEKLKGILNHFLEALAVMLVTSCLIPILVLFFFVWLIKLFLGADLPPALPPIGKSGASSPHGAPQNGKQQESEKE